jgi:SAM-dependent methyltransferase
MEDTSWNHNVHHHAALLRKLPPAPARALDIGCGAGDFARRLAERVAHVDAIDASAEMLRRAQSAGAGLDNVSYVHASIGSFPLEPASYDVISLLTVLHHLPLRETLRLCRDALRPGGVLLVLGWARSAGPLDRAYDLASIPVEFGLQCVHGPLRYTAPEMDTSLTVAQIAAVMRAELPGVKVRRQLLWRYMAVWLRPS